MRRRENILGEVIADIRNKLQAPLSVLSALAEGKRPPEQAVKIAKKDLEDIIETLNDLKE